jgi:hypothetical protein
MTRRSILIFEGLEDMKVQFWCFNCLWEVVCVTLQGTFHPVRICALSNNYFPFYLFVRICSIPIEELTARITLKLACEEQVNPGLPYFCFPGFWGLEKLPSQSWR